MQNRIIIAVLFLFFKSAIAQQNSSVVGVLPLSVSETSGLIFFNDRLITHNDSGNLPQLMEVDTTSLSVERTVSITNATNIDWEDITQDDSYIYVADIGNFDGDRTDLRVYRISKDEYLSTQTVVAELINFSYEDQTDFTPTQASDWDAEAIISFNDQLIIFTKQWQSQGTVAYTIPKTPGNHTAQRLDTFDANGLITAATFNPLSNVLYLLDYSNQLLPFSIRMEDVADTFGFNDSATRISLPIGLAQIEAITYTSVTNYYFSSERLISQNPPIALDQTLFRFSTDDVMVNGGNPDPPPGNMDPDAEVNLILYREFGSQTLNYDLNAPEEDIFGRAIFDATGKLIQFTEASDIDSNSIDISTFGDAVYYLTFYLRDEIISKAFIAN